MYNHDSTNQGGGGGVEVVGSFVKLFRQQNKKNYEPTLSLAVASFIFLARVVTPPLYVGPRFLRAGGVSWPLSYCLSVPLKDFVICINSR